MLSLAPMDRRRLEASVSSTAHRGLRMLCADELVDVDCPVDSAAGEFACVRISNIRLDINKIQGLVEPILRKLVNPPEDDGSFDTVAKPLSKLDERIDSFSDFLEVSRETLSLQLLQIIILSCLHFFVPNREESHFLILQSLL